MAFLGEKWRFAFLGAKKSLSYILTSSKVSMGGIFFFRSFLESPRRARQKSPIQPMLIFFGPTFFLAEFLKGETFLRPPPLFQASFLIGGVETFLHAPSPGG